LYLFLSTDLSIIEERQREYINVVNNENMLNYNISVWYIYLNLNNLFKFNQLFIKEYVIFKIFSSNG
jgi:hypothetical protein